MSGEQALAEMLLGRAVDHVSPLSGGGNNRLYRVVAAGSSFAMKLYQANDTSGRQRFVRETRALRLLATTTLADRVPRVVSASEAHSAVLFDWIDGVSPRGCTPDDLAEMLDFIVDLRSVGVMPAAQALDEAAEACLSAAELARQIDARRARLDSVNDEGTLTRYLDRFDRLWRHLRPTLVGTAMLPPSLRTLSPSDFGLHNALRQPDGRLVFLDFEYFGWDDPVKLAADIIWHPGMMLDEAAARTVQTMLTRLFARNDASYRQRLSGMFPAYGLRWCLILLNEFLPERWNRRRQAQDVAPTDWPAVKRRQLDKAERMIARVEACREEIWQ
jgi:hypothetical protein